MSAWIICPVLNGFHYTRDAVADFLAQDIGNVEILIVANSPTDGTLEWLRTQPRNVHVMHLTPPRSVAYSWNRALEYVFGLGEEYALVVNNDVRLRPDTFRLLVEDGGPFVTAVGVRDPKKIEPPYSRPGAPPRPHPDFSCFLIRKEVWEKVGPFDEKFEGAYAEDWDMHVRMHEAGIEAYCLDLPFLHFAAGTIKSTENEEVDAIHTQASKNRKYFKEKWGFAGGSKEYYAYFGQEPLIEAPEEGRGSASD
jgi:GT2 family glycosyltransferase